LEGSEIAWKIILKWILQIDVDLSGSLRDGLFLDWLTDIIWSRIALFHRISHDGIEKTFRKLYPAMFRGLTAMLECFEAKW
jgi:hypothetical protein